MDFPLFPFHPVPNGEKVFHFAEKILKHLRKYTFHVKVSLYMLGLNRDGLLNGVVRLIWRGILCICRAFYMERNIVWA